MNRSLKVRLYVYLSWVLFIGSVIGWPATHVLLIQTKPASADNWVFHLLLALSWLAILVGAVGTIVAADVKQEQEDDHAP